MHGYFVHEMVNFLMSVSAGVKMPFELDGASLVVKSVLVHFTASDVQRRVPVLLYGMRTLPPLPSALLSALRSTVAGAPTERVKLAVAGPIAPVTSEQVSVKVEFAVRAFVLIPSSCVGALATRGDFVPKLAGPVILHAFVFVFVEFHTR